MTSLKNKIVFITGASSGIGKACAEQFAAQGAKIVATARRLERLDELATELKNKYTAQVLTLAMDVQDKKQVATVIQNLPKEWQAIDILINNAGLALSTDKIQDGNIENWEIMINTNLCGLLYVTKAILPGMVTRNNGHIINIGSIAGQEHYLSGNIYCATKHAVRALTRSMRIDLMGTKIRVTEVAPGAVETEFSEVRWQDAERAKNFYADFTPLIADDIADNVVYAATRPAHVNITEILVCPIDQASVNHINKSGKIKGSIFE